MMSPHQGFADVVNRGFHRDGLLGLGEVVHSLLGDDIHFGQVLSIETEVVRHSLEGP